MTRESIDLVAKLALFTETWSPRVVAELNDYQFKLARLHGDFVWHRHDDTDEAFLMLEGSLVIEFHDGDDVTLGEGQLYVVPKGVEHKPRADSECHVLIVEPRGVVNTGDADEGPRAANDVWV